MSFTGGPWTLGLAAVMVATSCAGPSDEATFRRSLRDVATRTQATFAGGTGDWDALYAAYHRLQADGLEAGWLERREMPLAGGDEQAVGALRRALKDPDRAPVYFRDGGHEDFDAGWIWPEGGGAEPIGFEMVGYPENITAYGALVLELLGGGAGSG